MGICVIWAIKSGMRIRAGIWECEYEKNTNLYTKNIKDEFLQSIDKQTDLCIWIVPYVITELIKRKENYFS